MRRTLIAAVSVAGLGIALTACGDEDPTGVGSGLIGPGATTFELVLDAEEFLLSDTTFGGLGEFGSAPFRVVANAFEGEFTAHTLFQINRPFTVTYGTGEGSATRTDSLLAIRGATVTLVVDTVATSRLASIEVVPLLESWDPASVTWEMRHDTADDAEMWTTPGGTTGDVAGSAVWAGDSDTVLIQIDSASAAVWQDTTAARRGALVRVGQPGSRVRITSLEFSFNVVPEGTPDTVLTAGSSPRTSHVIEALPGAAPDSELRVGGIPIWRSLLNFRPLEEITFDACEVLDEPGLPTCDVTIADASVNLASLLLTTRPAGGFRAERGVRVGGRGVLDAPDVPLVRSPLTAPFGEMADSLPPSLFEPGATAEEVAVPLTGYVRAMLDIHRGASDGVPLDWIALTADREGATFGYTAFGSTESATPPRLRLVLTVPNEELYR
ncbi:MAG TPA: hypothetical protein VK966_10980 [Longimicrobiales bacterium]|nr:hypothetical protein [Longimicrobiales bacterium]